MKNSKKPNLLLINDGISDCRPEVAKRTFDRLRGLLGHPPLVPGQGLWIEPCNSIHTCFMSYPIDTVFINRQGRVLRVDTGVKPWAMRMCWRATAVLELAAGQAGVLGIATGMRLKCTEAAH